MDNIGVVLVLVGVVTGLVGMAGFFDTRKVDRRFKTGYKNNEPDTRNFGRAGKRVLYGIGICIVGMAVIQLTSPSQHSSESAPVNTMSSPQTANVTPTDAASNPVVALDPRQAEQRPDSGMALGTNERVVTSDTVAAAAGSTPEAPLAQIQSAPTQTAPGTVGCTDDGTFLGANICKSATLAAAYDRELKEYEAAQGRIGGNDVGVRIEQQNWLEQVTKECTDMSCLTSVFDARIADLHSRYRKNG
ncbi:hypothetical protein [Paraburkholderia aspalathi]|uniref:Uncharacterized protein n=1 Tax=Paraburkholderia aspalathi TaxID=1324617 RepID=A0A1I7EPP5_9BURK|nr:hypothetical protein [Paraburkholderia aspalathi]SFU25873.1 hypothetical protein SAMN05192563_10438 [Paraburkholderia aspalathi]